MKSVFIQLSFIVLLFACDTKNQEQLKAENAYLKNTIDSLNIELASKQKEVDKQRKIAEEHAAIAQRQEFIAKQQTELAQMEVIRAMVAEDSAYAAFKRAKEN